jgi:hypothetical protein
VNSKEKTLRTFVPITFKNSSSVLFWDTYDGRPRKTPKDSPADGSCKVGRMLWWDCLCDMVGSLKMNTALEYSTRVVQEGDRRCKKSTLNDLAYLTPLRIPLMNPVIVYTTGRGSQ